MDAYRSMTTATAPGGAALVSVVESLSERSKIDSEPLQPRPKHRPFFLHEPALLAAEQNVAHALAQHEPFTSELVSEAIPRELFVRLGHGERIDIAILRELPYRRQHLLFQIGLIEDAGDQQIHELAVNGYVLDPVRAGRLSHVPALYIRWDLHAIVLIS